MSVDGLFDVTGLSDGQLMLLASEVRAEQQARAVRVCDPDALIELGFREGFDSKGMPVAPMLFGERGAGVLVCPGTRIDKSSTSHDCSFVSVGGVWVWEHEDLIAEEIRNPPGPKRVMRSVSLLPVFETLAYDQVVSTAKMNVHSMKTARSFEIVDGRQVLVKTRTVRPPAAR